MSNHFDAFYLRSWCFMINGSNQDLNVRVKWGHLTDKIDRFQTGQNQYNNGDLNMMIWNKVFSLDGILFSFRGPFRHLRLHFDKLKLDRLTTLLHWPQLTALGYQKRIHEKGITTIPDHHITLSHLIHPHFNPYT